MNNISHLSLNGLDVTVNHDNFRYSNSSECSGYVNISIKEGMLNLLINEGHMAPSYSEAFDFSASYSGPISSVANSTYTENILAKVGNYTSQYAYAWDDCKELFLYNGDNKAVVMVAENETGNSYNAEGLRNRDCVAKFTIAKQDIGSYINIANCSAETSIEFYDYKNNVVSKPTSGHLFYDIMKDGKAYLYAYVLFDGNDFLRCSVINTPISSSDVDLTPAN